MFKKRHWNDINSSFFGGNISNFCNDSSPRAVSGRGVFTSSASCHPSPAAVFEMGDFVLYRDRSCVIHHIRQPIGTSKTFDITDVTKGDLFVAYNYEVSHMRLEDALLECSFEMDETESAEFPVESKNNKQQDRFGKITQTELNDLTDSCIEKTTKKQTSWAVRPKRAERRATPLVCGGATNHGSWRKTVVNSYNNVENVAFDSRQSWQLLTLYMNEIKWPCWEYY